MHTTCENCFTLHEPSGIDGRPIGCPYCGHMNQARIDVKDRGPDQSKSVLNFLDGEMLEEGSAVRKLIFGIPPPSCPRMNRWSGSWKAKKKDQTFSVRKPKITIGRKGPDIQLSDSEVSRRHCVIPVFGDALMFRDLQSSNGTMVNRSLVKEIPLKDGDQMDWRHRIFGLAAQGSTVAHCYKPSSG
jgi:hypothetical protein